MTTAHRALSRLRQAGPSRTLEPMRMYVGASRSILGWTAVCATILATLPVSARGEDERAGHVVMLFVNLPQVIGFDVHDRVVLWREEKGLSPTFYAPRRTPDGRVFLDERGKRIVCADLLTGKHLYEWNCGEWKIGTAWATDGDVWVGRDDEALVGRDARTGEVLWHIRSPPFEANEESVERTVHFLRDEALVSLKGSAMAVEKRSGDVRWEIELAENECVYVRNGLVLRHSDVMEPPTTFARVDPADGHELWRVEVPDFVSTWDIYVPSEASNTILVSHDDIVDSRSRIVALAADSGEERWRLRGAIDYLCMSTDDGTVWIHNRIVGTRFHAGTLDRVDLRSGEILSSRKVKHLVVYGFAREDRLFLLDSMPWGDLDQKDRSKLDYVPGVEFMAFDLKTGKELWSSSPPELQPEKPAGRNARLRWADDHLVVILEADGVARVAKIDPSTGEVVWVQDVE